MVMLQAIKNKLFTRRFKTCSPVAPFYVKAAANPFPARRQNGTGDIAVQGGGSDAKRR
jgi:hypothetical protein